MPDPEAETDLHEIVTSKVLAAINAEESGDIDLAIQLMEHAEMALAAIPDGRNEESEVKFDREAMGNTLARLKRKRNTSGGVVAEAVRNVRG